MSVLWIGLCFQTLFPIPQLATAAVFPNPILIGSTVLNTVTPFCCGPVPMTYITIRALILSLSSHLFGFVWLCHADAAQPFFSVTRNEKAVWVALNAV